MEQTPESLRAVAKGKPAQVAKYLASKFGPDLDAARAAMEELAARIEPVELQRRGFRPYERFRPDIPAGEPGWGVKGEPDLMTVRAAG